MAKVLFIGGTGQISLPCVQLAAESGHQVTVFNRGQRHDRLPGNVASITGDMADASGYAQLGAQNWDVVAQFMVFTPEQMQRDIATFAGKTGQYIFISSASVYQKTIDSYVITEQTPAINPYWGYSQAKDADDFVERYAESYAAEIDHFITCVETGQRPDVTASDGRKAMILCEAALASAKSGRFEAVRF